ncbi:uncharacterized protein LOC129572126 [Sitodiplosis mosellana]|uniref:uncharacterized protein LOC129572126 n=1 Tax=Sitodiplosis mosellana TaxID=263140 RepID=UPI00244486ED|nr:uncharacterized protein LOC129572126 [Sitodiplosis mosellana]
MNKPTQPWYVGLDVTQRHESYRLIIQRFLIVHASGAPSRGNVNEKVLNGETALHRAAVTGNVKEAQKLIDQGAEVNIESVLNETPLHYAASNGHRSVAEFLIRKGANTCIKNNANLTPLQVAVNNGKAD